jgi:hypothetical protein
MCVPVWKGFLFDAISTQAGARGILVVKALSYKLEGRGFETRWGEILNLPNLAALDPTVYSASNIN